MGIYLVKVLMIMWLCSSDADIQKIAKEKVITFLPCHCCSELRVLYLFMPSPFGNYLFKASKSNSRQVVNSVKN